MNLKEKENDIILLNCIDDCTDSTIKEILDKEIDIAKFAIDYSIKNLSNEFLNKLYEIEIKRKEKKININNDFLLFENHLLYYLNNKEFSNIKKESIKLSIKFLENSLIVENKEKIINNLSKKIINISLFDKKENNKIISYNNYFFKNNHYKTINNIKINSLKINDFINYKNLFNRFLQLEKRKERKLNYLYLKERLLINIIKESKKNISIIFLEKELKKLRKRIKNISNINIKRNCIKILDKYYSLNTNEKIRNKLVEIVKNFYYLIDLNNNSNNLKFNFKSIEKEINNFNIISYTKSKRNNKIIKTKRNLLKRNRNLIKELDKNNFNSFYYYLKNNKENIKIFSLKKNKTLKELFLESEIIFKVDLLIFENCKWYFNKHLQYIIKYNSFDKEIYIFDKNYRYDKLLKNLKTYNKNLINKKEKELSFYKKESKRIQKYYKKGLSDDYKNLLNLSESDLIDKYKFYLSKEYNENKNQYIIDLKLNQIEKILFDRKIENNQLLKDKIEREKIELEYNNKYNKDLSKFKGYSINKNSYVNYEFLEIGYTENNELKIFNEPNEDSLGDRDYY